MRDGQTQKLTSSTTNPDPGQFFAKHSAQVVVVKGAMAGSEFHLKKVRTILGRGPAVDILIKDATMSRQHVAFDLVSDGIRVQDLGSTNGILLNGSAVSTAELKNGDRLEIGEHEFRFLLESLDDQPRTWVVE
jgi:pSer/pThr/pTyr-binding forkhead associated (FHA) protein